MLDRLCCIQPFIDSTLMWYVVMGTGVKVLIYSWRSIHNAEILYYVCVLNVGHQSPISCLKWYVNWMVLEQCLYSRTIFRSIVESIATSHWFFTIQVIQYQNLPLTCNVTLSLAHCIWDRMGAIVKTTFLNASFWMKMYEFWFKFHGSLALRVRQ